MTIEQNSVNASIGCPRKLMSSSNRLSKSIRTGPLTQGRRRYPALLPHCPLHCQSKSLLKECRGSRVPGDGCDGPARRSLTKAAPKSSSMLQGSPDKPPARSREWSTGSWVFNLFPGLSEDTCGWRTCFHRRTKNIGGRQSVCTGCILNEALSSVPRDQRCTIWALGIWPKQSEWLADWSHVCALKTTLDYVIQEIVSQMASCTALAREAMVSETIDEGAAGALVFEHQWHAKTQIHCHPHRTVPSSGPVRWSGQHWARRQNSVHETQEDAPTRPHLHLEANCP